MRGPIACPDCQSKDERKTPKRGQNRPNAAKMGMSLGLRQIGSTCFRFRATLKSEAPASDLVGAVQIGSSGADSEDRVTKSEAVPPI
jgi:hypothetical protein